MFNDNMSRREFLSSSAKAGISVAALATFLSSCGVTGERKGEEGATITIAINESPWLPSFQEIVRVYQEETGSGVEVQAFPFDDLRSKELNAVTNEMGDSSLL